MISAGAMNRRVRLEGFTSTRDPESNEEIQTWTPLATVWAHRRDTSAREFAAGGSAANTEQVAVFTVWWREGVTSQLRVVDRGQVFDITGVIERGQRYQLELQGKAVNSDASE